MNKTYINKSNIVFADSNYTWSNDINNYQHSKQNLEWGKNPKFTKITHKDIKTTEVFFNPITQKYNNHEVENKIKHQESKVFPNKIATFFDKSLRYEQTFDIITLKDKLNVFTNHPDYPKGKSERSKTLIDHSKIDYNILSNKKILEHHFDKPENRPVKPSTSPIIKKQKKQAWSFKDYDIISNQYIENNTDKKKVDELAFKFESANRYWKTHNFNPVVGEYYNKDKEEYFQKERKERETSWGKNQVTKLPKKVQEQGLLYNPVNQQVLDSERLAIYEQKEKNKKRRYEKRKDVENYYFNKSLTEAEKKEKIVENKKSYEPFKEEDTRGYNIINFNNNFNKYKSNQKFKDLSNPWEQLKQKAGKESSLNKKIFKNAYDYSDVEYNLHKFKSERNSKLNIILFNIQTNIVIIYF